MLLEKADDLKSLISGIRNHAGKEEQYIHRALRDIRGEIRHGTRTQKAEGVLKLWYLHMMGYDASFGFFSMIEVMSFSSFQLRRPGFFAAACCFQEDTPVTLLSINLFKKLLNQPIDLPTTSMVLSCLSCLATVDMARDLYPNVATLITSSKGPIRRRAVMCLFCLARKFPPSLEELSMRFKELLKDPDDLVVSAAISVLLELGSQYAKDYLHLVPTLFQRWTCTNSSWEALKLIKLFRLYCSFEPRLAPKLHTPLLKLINSSTIVRSVEYEVFRLILDFYPASLPIVRDCVERIRVHYLNSSDINLNVLGLSLLASKRRVADSLIPLLQSVFENELLSQVISYVSSCDAILRTSALYIIHNSANKDNFAYIAQELLTMTESANVSSCSDFVETLLYLGESNRFSLVQDFPHYISTVARIALCKLNRAVSNKLCCQFKLLGANRPKLRPLLFRALCVSLMKRASKEENSRDDELIRWWFTPGSAEKKPTFDRSSPSFLNDQETSNDYAGSTHENQTTALLKHTDREEEAEDGVLDNGDVLLDIMKQDITFTMNEDIVKDILLMIGEYSKSIGEPLNDTQEIVLLHNLANTVFDISAVEYCIVRQVISSGGDQRRKWICFVIYLSLFLSLCTRFSCVVRSTAAMTAIKLFSVLIMDSPRDVMPFTTRFALVCKTFFHNTSPTLHLTAKLIQSIVCHEEATLLRLARELGGIWTGSLENPHQASLEMYLDDVDQPFYDTLITVQKTTINTKSSPTTSRSGDEDSVVHSPVPFPLWQLLIQKEDLSLFTSFVGRCSHAPCPYFRNSCAPYSFVLSIAVDILCENHHSEPLRHVQLEQLDTAKKMTLCTCLTVRSKKARFILVVEAKTVLKGDARVMCRLSYEKGDEKCGFLVPFQISSYHLLRPLCLDEDVAAVVIKTQKDNIESRATVVVEDLLINQRAFDILDKYIGVALDVAARIANLHILLRPSESYSITALLIGSQWTSETEHSGQLERIKPQPLSMSNIASINLNQLDIPLLFALVTCSVAPSPSSSLDSSYNEPHFPLKITVVTRTQDPGISERCASDLSDVLDRVFRQNDLLVEKADHV